MRLDIAEKPVAEIEFTPTTMKWHLCQAQILPSRVFFSLVWFRLARVSDELSRSTIRARDGAVVGVRRRCRNRGHGVQSKSLAPVGARDRRLWTTRTRSDSKRLLGDAGG